MTTKSAKHADKTFGSAKDKSAKAVDIRKVAALSVGAAGVIAGAAIAFGATPAMAAEANVAPVNTNDSAKEQNLVASNKAEDSKKTATDTAKEDDASKVDVSKKNSVDAKPVVEAPQQTKVEAPTDSKKSADAKQSVEPKVTAAPIASTESTEENKTGKTEITKSDDVKADNKAVDNKKDVKQDAEETSTPAGSVVNKRTRRSLDEKKQPEPTKDTQAEKQDRAEGDSASQDPNKINPDTSDSTNTKIEVNENNAGTMPNMYGWGSSDNTYSINGETHTVTFNFAKPKDGTITAIAIFPAQNNGLNNDKSKRGAEYYSGDPKMHQSFSGNYTFKTNGDGSATLTMSDLFRDGNLNGGAEAYAANRSIFVYVTKDGNTTVYKTNAFRAATLVPPKTSGSIVLKYNQPLTKEQIKAAITAAANAETARKDKKSVNDQIIAASKANGVNTTVNGKSTQVPDTLTDKINASSADAYDAKQFDAINTKKTGDTNSYVAGAKTLNTYMVTDLGFKSEAIPLTVARYDDRIDKPIVEDLTNVSTEVKEDIKKKLAKINGVTPDKITFDGDDNAVIHFDGVDEKDAPKIALRNLVLKQLKDTEYKVPTGSEAVFVYNPLAYNDAEIARIKKAIYEANKDNKELGLSEKDYENQISLSYLTGNLTATGDSNKGISNGQAENIITVKIKTDKSVAEFKSDVKARKLTKLPNIRTDYTVTWAKDKIDNRTTDEGLSWSEDHKTIIYRYDPTKAEEFDTNKILGLLTATPNDPNSGLRKLTGGEALDHEGADGKDKKSHVGYVIDKNGQPTTELSLGKMDGAYWKYSRNVDNSGVDLGNEESNAGSYSWDKDAKPVVVAAKQDKVYKARLFVLPYGLTMYRNIYMENGNQPWNTPKAINVIFVPQTNHKKQQLNDSIDQYKTTKVNGKDVPTQHEYYNASDSKKAEYDEALKKANEALKEAGDTEDSKLSEELKARIDNATIRLDKAREALDGAKTDKTKLEQDIKDQGNPKKDNTAASGTYETDKYKNVTEPSFLKEEGGKLVPDTDKNKKAAEAKEAYDKALEDANKVKADENATQKAVDEAKAKLDAARKELDKYSTNKDKLNAAIAEHGKVNTGDPTKTGDDKLKTADPTYQNSTKDERTAYDNAVKKANELSKDPNASQKEVNEAITALKDAKAKLDAKATNKAKLAAAVQQTFDNPNPNDANGKKSTFYKNALGKKNSTDPNVTQEQKNAAEKAINDYDQALAKAKELLEDKNGKATQAQVDAAVQALTDAEDKLHKYSTDKNDLTKALADNIDGYLKPAYFNAFDKAQAGDNAAKQAFKEYNDAYHAAKELKEKFAKTNPAEQPSDEDCKKAKEALDKARQVIDTYATDTKKLSAAFWNDIAIQNSPAYKNAKALAEKQNPTEDEKAQVEAAKKIKNAYDDAVNKLHKAFENKLDKDPDAQDTKIPDAKGDPTSKNYLDGIQTHANGEPLDRDVTEILTAMNDAADQLKQFATKTDKLQESINKDTDTQKDPAYKNAKDPHKLDTHGMEDTSGYDAIKEKATAYDNALKAAKELMVKPDATQEEVNSALKTLDEARKALEGYKTNVEDLKKSVEAHGSTDGPATKEGTVTSDVYRNASDPHFLTADGKPDDTRNNAAKEAKKAYDAALLKAQDLLKKADAKKNKTPLDAQPIQKEIDAALTTLNEKRKALDVYKTDTSKLDEEAKKSTAEGATVADADFEATPEFKNAKAKTSNGVENTDVTAYTKALKDARGLLAKKDSATLSERPTQKQINDALDALKQAKKQIEDNYKTDTSKLEEAKKYAEDVFKKTPEYKNALAKKEAGDQTAISHLGKDGEKTGFDNVLKKVTDDLNNDGWKGKVTQKFVDKLLEKLQEAQDNITKNYKTDVTPLSNEVGDKDQDGKPVTPKFEESIPYKNALEKAKTEDSATTDPNSATKKLEDYNKKLKAAQKIIDQVNNPDPNADVDKQPTNADVKKALDELQQAKKAIDEAFTTKVDALKKETKELKDDGNAKEDKYKFENSTEFKNASAKTNADSKKDVQTYKDALKKANELLGKFDENGKPKADAKDVPTQKEVDEALKNLKEIKDKITKNYVTSPHDLQQEVDKSKDGDTDTSTDVFENTPEFKNATAKGDEAAKKDLDDYNTKLKDAKKLLDAFDRTTGKPKDQLPQGMDKAPTQQELDKALKDLQDAKKKITDGYKTDSSKLKSEADADSNFTKTPEYVNAQAKGDDASKQDLDAYKKALEDANKVLGDKNATQAQVDDALKKLQDAKSKLSDGYKTNKSDLNTEAGKNSDFTKTPEYQNAAGSPEAEAYKKALEDANKVLSDEKATQAEVDAALKKLQDAKQKLADSHKTDKSDLNTEAGNDPDFRKSIPFIIG
ncbi:peptidase, partial [Gardnerella vaginalis]|uniref:peptidase n=1 Tax=Gardnerella vaginalis TaxID=2702 RepID=UPI0039F05177